MKYHHAASDPGIEKDMFSDLQNHLGGGGGKTSTVYVYIDLLDDFQWTYACYIPLDENNRVSTRPKLTLQLENEHHGRGDQYLLYT